MIWIQVQLKHGKGQPIRNDPVTIMSIIKEAPTYELMSVYYHFVHFLAKNLEDKNGMKRKEVYFLMHRYLENMEYNDKKEESA